MPKKPDTFARRLRQLRKAADISIYALAARCGLSRAFLGRLEAGKQEPSLEAASKIAHALDRNLDAWEGLW